MTRKRERITKKKKTVRSPSLPAPAVTPLLVVPATGPSRSTLEKNFCAWERICTAVLVPMCSAERGGRGGHVRSQIQPNFDWKIVAPSEVCHVGQKVQGHLKLTDNSEKDREKADPGRPPVYLRCGATRARAA